MGGARAAPIYPIIKTLNKQTSKLPCETNARSLVVLAFSDGNNLLLVTIGLVGDEALLGASVKDFLDLLDDIGEMSLSWEGEILLEVVTDKELSHTFVINAHAEALSLLDDGGWDHITSSEGLIVLLVCEHILSGDHGLGGAVLTGLGSREGSNLAWVLLLHDDEGAGLHAASFLELGDEGTGITLFELVVVAHNEGFS